LRKESARAEKPKNNGGKRQNPNFNNYGFLERKTFTPNQAPGNTNPPPKRDRYYVLKVTPDATQEQTQKEEVAQEEGSKKENVAESEEKAKETVEEPGVAVPQEDK
jgi:hypothetical protein